MPRAHESSKATREQRPAASDEPLALQDRALQNLRYIRETMDRTASFTAVSGFGHGAAGITALAAAAIAAGRTGEAWLWIWLVEAVIGLAVTTAFSVRKAGRASVPLTRGAGRKFLLGFMPPAATAVVLTPALVAAGAMDQLPAVWLLLYGAAITTAGAFSVRAVPAMGVAFMAVGILAAAFPAGRDAWLAVGFGGLHLVFGAFIARRHGG